MDLIEELIEIRKIEPWQEKLEKPFLRQHYESLIKNERIIPYIVNEELLGYVEFSRLNFAQLGYVVVTSEIVPELFDRQGNIVFITNLHLKEGCVDSVGLIRHFKREILSKYPKVCYMVGQHQGKRLKPYAIHKLRGN